MTTTSVIKYLVISLLIVAVALFSGYASPAQEVKKGINQLPLKKTTSNWNQQTEWSFYEGLYFTSFIGWLQKGNFQTTDYGNPYKQDADRIVTLTDDVFIYEPLNGKIRYIATQVSNDFISLEPKSL